MSRQTPQEKIKALQRRTAASLRAISEDPEEWSSGLRSAPDLNCICRLRGRKHKVHTAWCEPLPSQAHIRGFRNTKTGELVLTHHPYCRSSEELASLTKASQEFADKHGLLVQISDQSWYVPHQTVLVQYRVKET